MLKNISAKCLYSVPVVVVSTKDPYTELEMTVGHWPFSDQFPHLAKSDLLGQIYCTFPMGKPLTIYCNVSAFKEWLTNFKLLFQALPYSST